MRRLSTPSRFSKIGTGLLVLFQLTSASPAFSDQIDLLSISIGSGKKEVSTGHWSDLISATSKCESSLETLLNQSGAAIRCGEKIFVLFYNRVRALNCKRNYLIQKVRLMKSTYDSSDQHDPSEHSYLVEAFKLDKNGEMVRSDEHRKFYPLRDNHGRELIAEYQVGCGEIRGVLEGEKWPFGKDDPYKKLQDYSPSMGVYDRVRFDFSRSYRLKVRFDKQGEFFVDFPSFVGSVKH